jgi:hypothetical protein
VLYISRDDLQALIDANSVTLIEALPEPPCDAEHLPGPVNLPGDLIGARCDGLTNCTCTDCPIPFITIGTATCTDGDPT